MVKIIYKEGSVEEISDAYAVVLDGFLTKDISRAAETTSVDFLVATNSKISPKDTSVRILMQKDLK